MASIYNFKVLKEDKFLIKRLDQFLSLEKEKYLPLEPKEEMDLKGDIKISHLSFHYPSHFDEVLEDINITIPQGNTFRNYRNSRKWKNNTCQFTTSFIFCFKTI